MHSIAIQAQQPRQLDQQPRLSQLMEAFLQSLDISSSSKRTYKRQLKQFVEWLEQQDQHISELTREDLLRYKKALMESSKSARTVSGYLTPVRRLFEWLEANKIYPNVAKGIKGAKQPRGYAKDVLSKQQLQAVLSEIDHSSLEGLRDYALFNLLARTGLRTIELERAEIQDMRSLSGERVLWIQGKGRDSKDEFVLLTQQAYEPIKAYLAARSIEEGRALQDQDPLFASLSDRSLGSKLVTRSIRYVIKKRLRAAGLNEKRLSAHSLRHTAITLAIQAGASMYQAQAMARHSSIKTTEIYFHNQKRISAAAENLISF